MPDKQNTVLFTEIAIHDMFIAHETVWAKTTHTAAVSIGPSKIGHCNFTTSGAAEDNKIERVQQLNMDWVGDLLYAAYKK